MNNKCADQSARMHRLVCVVHKPPKTGSPFTKPKFSYGSEKPLLKEKILQTNEQSELDALNGEKNSKT